ncbi:MAG: hypothetical protein ACRD3Y_04595 [Bryobacteraceae bacterium]
MRRIELRYVAGRIVLWEARGHLCGILASWTLQEWLDRVSLGLWYPPKRSRAF